MKHFVEVMISQEEITKRVDELANQISKDYFGEEIILVGLLRGSIVFLSDISRKIENKCVLDVMCVSSYGDSMSSSGIINITKDLEENIENRNVIIIEDIIDTGLTLSKIKELLLTRSPKSLKICTLLDKKVKRVADVKVDYVGFEIPDEFVVGYGIDYAQQYRTLPYIGKVIKLED